MVTRGSNFYPIILLNITTCFCLFVFVFKLDALGAIEIDKAQLRCCYVM